MTGAAGIFEKINTLYLILAKAFYEGTYRYSGVEVDGQHQAIL
jgi:hypothetical protein